MDEADSSKIRSNYVELIRNLNPEDVTDFLYQERVLTEEDIEKVNSGPTRAQRARNFLSILQLKTDNGLSKFLDALRQGGYDQLATKIENTASTHDDGTEEETRTPVQDSESQRKQILQEQSEVVTEMMRELEQLKLNTEKDSKRIELLELELKKERDQKSSLVSGVYEELQKQQEVTDSVDAETDESEEQVEEGYGEAAVTKSVKRSPSKTLMRLFVCGSSMSAGDKKSNLTCDIKCVVVGEGAVGKTCLEISYIYDEFPGEYYPTVFENYVVTRQVETQDKTITVHIHLCDTAGQEDYDRLRPLSYPQTDVFLLVFSIMTPDSFENIMARWYPETKHFMKTAPRILVGTMLDLARDRRTIEELQRMKQRPVTKKQADSLAQSIKAVGGQAYFVSALTREGLNELMTLMVQTALAQKGLLTVDKYKVPEKISMQ